MDSKTGKKLYDEFTCIGGQCPFTCCKGWEISVDPQTYAGWKKEFKESDHVKNTVCKKKPSRVGEYKINMGQDKCCPFFNEEGLCRVVITKGEAYLPKICREFPRIINDFGNREEYSLSCACPEVVDMLQREGDELQLFAYKGDWTDKETSHWEDLRELLLAILSNSDFALRDRLLLGLIVLSDCAKNDIITKEAVEKYREEQQQGAVLRLWREGERKTVDSCLEVNELFLDITENYRKEEYYRRYLEPLAAFAEDLDVRTMVTGQEAFENVFSGYDKLVEHCLKLKVFSECAGDDIEDILLAFQRIILEYAMLRHSAFLIWLRQGGLTYQDVRDYIVIYTRIIGNNPEGIREFFQDSFEEGAWEPWYFLLLLN